MFRTSFPLIVVPSKVMIAAPLLQFWFLRLNTRISEEAQVGELPCPLLGTSW